ncbi:MAG: 2-oxo-3-hexenedioate decarboxylase [Saprospiraceae bacterium]|jgi:2-oxo-3-hexenedioate decarboxylase
MNYNQIAETLDLASYKAKATEQISNSTAINLEQAYAIQSISIARRYIRGEKLLGLKLGFTSKAKMEQMGVHDMIWGRLTDKMFYNNGSALAIKDFIHPRAEPEIAFRISKTIDQTITLANAKDYVDGVAVAIEVIDSRYQNFKFSLEDVVADNCSSAGFTHGDWLPADTNIQDVKMSLSFDGEEVEKGNSNAILGNPWESFVAAARLARENGEILNKGAIILAGAATTAVFIKQGQKVAAHADGLGKVSLNIV